MKLDFSKLSTGTTTDTIINPRDLFNALSHKDKKYQYPRDVQSNVWKEWFTKKDNSTNIIKMNTGSGKTVVGLTILKSSINEGLFPAVYVVPDNFLVEQVTKEATQLGIKTTKDTNSINFQRGKEILVCTIDKLVNGMSKFGVNEKKIEIESIIVDDAHACIDRVESQFTISIASGSELYKALLTIFLPSIKEQSESKAIELENSQPNSMTVVPFWAWQSHITKIVTLLNKFSSSDELKFSYPLLKETLLYSRCVISSSAIEITPHVIPISQILSYEQAKRKIFMTATLVDDSILSTHFNINRESLSNIITPETAGDIGDRLIVVPQAIKPQISDIELKKYYKKLSTKYNVVVIVPSFYRLNSFWKDVVDLTITNEDIHLQIEKMKTTHIGLIIIVNRYDGIDLPDDACRVLVIDGLPDVRKLIDQVEDGQLSGSSKAIDNKIQKIEQGMGRAVRSNEDYCVVFLMGKTLIQQLYSKNGTDKFSIATRTQFVQSEKLYEQLKDIEDIDTAVQYVLSRDDDWVSVSKASLASLKYEKNSSNEFSIIQRESFNKVVIKQYDKAIDLINKYLEKIFDDKILLGFVKQTLAEYINYKDTNEAQKLLLSAVQDNNSLLKPIVGISYERINLAENQAINIQKHIVQNYNNQYNKLLIDLSAILEDLIFLPDTYNKFEEAIKNLGILLGFKSQRPEIEFKSGPDNLWAVGNNEYFILECKNGVTTNTICKHDIAQLNTSIAWFQKEYDLDLKHIPIMIHLSNICEHSATPLAGCKVITKENLEKLKSNINSFFVALKDNINTKEEIKKLLATYQLRIIDLSSVYCEDIRISGKDK